ncbi:MAG TPA: SRPBCC family protein [Anaerolineales bacterium]|nr:SRPBCC family protein [Anaerolineales bacterium]
MAAADYHFITRWHLSATTVEEVSDVLGNASDLARWWPSVYLDVKELEPGDPETGIGKVVDLYTKGWLPYTLRWQFRVTGTNMPHGYALEARGDFIGRGVWTFEPEGDGVLATYDWKIRAGKPLLRRLSFLLKPVFSANHVWAMKMGERSLLLELERRRAATPEEAARVPPPPGPTFGRIIRKN